MGSAGSTSVVTFVADDGVNVVSNYATIVVPWDANGNDIPDDWEFRYFNGDLSQTKDGDYDNDKFSNFAEWLASTDPMAAGSYIGWEMQMVVNDGMLLRFQSVDGRTYHIEGNDGDLPNAAAWHHLATVYGTGTQTDWVDNAYPTNAVRHYRIKIPRHVP